MSIITTLKPIGSVTILALVAAGLVCGQEIKKVSQAEALKNVVARVQPDYPPAAKQLRIQDTVALDILIGETGAVDNVEIVSGNPLLTRPAADALRKWKFKPFLADGKAVRVATQISVTFKL